MHGVVGGEERVVPIVVPPSSEVNAAHIGHQVPAPHVLLQSLAAPRPS
jgi:hypothetical protein